MGWIIIIVNVLHAACILWLISLVTDDQTRILSGLPVSGLLNLLENFDVLSKIINKVTSNSKHEAGKINQHFSGPIL